jgi:uncharacterized YigZ family protein
MNLPEEIRTIEDFKETITTINKSRFIAKVYSVKSENDVKDYLTKAKKKYYDASHHCYGYKLADGKFHYSDAGEPNGTAGIRILNAIEHFELVDQLVIVSRIFGGIKLGVGPLGKAYYESAFQVLKESKIELKSLYQKVLISSEFNQVSLIHRILTQYKSIIAKSEYEDSLRIECLIKPAASAQIHQILAESGKNRIKIDDTSEFIYK